jgi:hypothetical protein
MTRTSQVTIAAVVAIGALLVNDRMSLTQPSSLVSQAEARIGRPLSPMSVAGVARRQTRRAVYGGGYYGGAYHRAGLYGAGIVATGGALAIARYRGNWGNYGYGGWSDYASRNGIICEPGTLVRLQDGQQYLCQ